MLRDVHRRKPPEPLQPTRAPAWLVVRNQLSEVVDSLPLEPYADLRAILTAMRDSRIADGWQCEEIGRWCGFFFCERDGERQLVTIEARKPPPVGTRW